MKIILLTLVFASFLASNRINRPASLNIERFIQDPWNFPSQNNNRRSDRRSSSSSSRSRGTRQSQNPNSNRISWTQNNQQPQMQSDFNQQPARPIDFSLQSCQDIPSIGNPIEFIPMFINNLQNQFGQNCNTNKVIYEEINDENIYVVYKTVNSNGEINYAGLVYNSSFNKIINFSYSADLNVVSNQLGVYVNNPNRDLQCGDFSFYFNRRAAPIRTTPIQRRRTNPLIEIGNALKR